jgi:hypothetical protein
MLIKTLASAVAANADARSDAAMISGAHLAFGPGAVVRERPWIGESGSESQTGIAGAGGKALGGFGPCVVYPVPLAGDRLGALQVSTVQNSIARKSIVQHNTNEKTRLYPATRGGVGPHPAREPEPV